MVTYIYVERSPTNRATCKYCGEKILKDEIRVRANSVGVTAKSNSSGCVHFKCIVKSANEFLQIPIQLERQKCMGCGAVNDTVCAVGTPKGDFIECDACFEKGKHREYEGEKDAQ